MRGQLWLLVALGWGGWIAGTSAIREGTVQTPSQPTYRIETIADRAVPLRERFTTFQLGLLEKLNRADLAHLERLSELVVPASWGPDELAHSGLPAHYPSGEPFPKLLVVHLRAQMFGAYESGRLVRWGPVSSAGRGRSTPAGIFSLNWRSTGHTSTVDPDWFMRWYFNFGNREGLALHEYALPGVPASHGCIRLLPRDAQWLFEWGETWVLDASGTRIVKLGTPVFIIGQYDFTAPPPWRSPAWLAQPVDLPPFPGGSTEVIEH
jgi:hypothetical protein